MVALKKKKPSLKVWLSIGGWALGGRIFSDMVRFKGTRNNFITSAIEVMDAWGFDGIDIDWEYPAAEDRGKVLSAEELPSQAKIILSRWSQRRHGQPCYIHERA